MVGEKIFLSNAEARGFAKPESAKIKAQLGDPPEHQVPASE